MSIITDNTVLVHIYSGLESKNKVTLGLLVALTAEKNDHKVTLFLAGDGVQILDCKKLYFQIFHSPHNLYSQQIQHLPFSYLMLYIPNPQY